MTNVNINHLHKELLYIKKDVELIKNILAEEGKLTEETKLRLAKARATSISEYKRLEELDYLAYEVLLDPQVVSYSKDLMPDLQEIKKTFLLKKSV